MGPNECRRGLVLGGGGVLGFAWTIGALAAVEEICDVDCRDVPMIVGTSAGAVIASLLGCGVSVDEMLRQQLGIAEPGDSMILYRDELNDGRARPQRPKFRIGSARLLLAAARRPRRLPKRAVLSGAMPRGRASLEPIARVVREALGARGSWTTHPSVWIMAMDYATGERVAFGNQTAPSATLPEAVAASCAIPGWFAPIQIGGRFYVDGGMYSTTSADLLAGQGLDEVFVLAPMASFATDSPSSLSARLERRWRAAVARGLRREAMKVLQQGAHVYLLCPGVEDLRVMGANVMDTSLKAQTVEIGRQTARQLLSEQRIGVSMAANATV